MKKFQKDRSGGKKITAVSKWALKIASVESADMDQTGAKTASWFLPSPSGELKKGFVHWRCGPILTRIGAYKTKISNFFDVGVPFFIDARLKSQ